MATPIAWLFLFQLSWGRGSNKGSPTLAYGIYAYKIDYVNYTDTSNVEKFVNSTVPALKTVPERRLGFGYQKSL